MSSSVGVGGDDNREWTIRKLPYTPFGVILAGSPLPKDGSFVVPRSRLERVEAERDALRLEVEALRRDHGRLQQAMNETDDVIKGLL
jgi:hypothetical protein